MYVYILRCADESFYVGVTNNLERRLLEHNSSEAFVSFTFSRKPVELVYYENFYSPEAAIKREKQLKGWSRAKKQALINENRVELILLSVYKNSTSHKNLKREKVVKSPFDSAQGDP